MDLSGAIFNSFLIAFLTNFMQSSSCCFSIPCTSIPASTVNILANKFFFPDGCFQIYIWNRTIEIQTIKISTFLGFVPCLLRLVCFERFNGHCIVFSLVRLVAKFILNVLLVFVNASATHCLFIHPFI